MARNALGWEFDSATRLSERPGSEWNCLWGHALKRSPMIIRKSRVSYPGPGFLSNATWPSLPKKHYNGLINRSHGVIKVWVLTVDNYVLRGILVLKPYLNLLLHELDNL